MNEENIHKYIDLYFEAKLSKSEEDDLFHSLLDFEGKDCKVEETLAVMLMARNPSVLLPESKAHRLHSLERGFTSLRFLTRIAVIALVVISCTTVLLSHFHKNSGDEIDGMMAYVGGVKVNDHSEIMKIVDDQLNDISMSSEFFSQTIASDLDDIRNAFNEEGI